MKRSSLAAGKSNGKRIVFMYHLCTIYVQFFVLSHITINELRLQKCTIAYKRVFSESSQSQKNRNNRMFFTPWLAFATAPACEFYSSLVFLLTFPIGKTHSPCKENILSLQGENIILAGRKRYPCRESRR